VKSITSTKT